MIEETVKVVADAKFPLDGLLTLPENLDAPAPAVILVHGSGPTDKNEQIGKCALFKDLAESLATRGIASLRYDKRTLIYGLEMVKSPALSVREETIDDALAAAELLREDARIDRQRIFIIGHSMGAMLAPRIDAEGGDFVGLILLAGSPRRLEEIILEQNAAVVPTLPDAVRAQAEQQSAAMEAGFSKLYTLTDEEAQQTDVLPNVKAYYFKEWGEKPASQYLLDLTKPLLILQGEADFQVSLTADFAAYQKLLTGKNNVTFKSYPGLNHLFMPTQGKKITDGLAEYEVENHLATQVADDVARFILRQY